MKKFLLPGILAALAFLLPSKSQAVTLDVPYQVSVTTFNAAGTVVLSTTNFPAGGTTVNANVANYQWCVDHANVSAASAAFFTIYWSTGNLTVGTTDYAVTTAAAVPFDTNFNYRSPYCAPVGAPTVTLKSSVAASTVTVQGYLWKGWNP